MGRITKAKWFVGFAVLAFIVFSIGSKLIQIAYLKNNGWDMSSFSSLSIFFIFAGSVAFLGLAFLDRGFNKRSLKKPDQIVFIVGGFVGLFYAGFLTIVKLMDMGLLRS